MYGQPGGLETVMYVDFTDIKHVGEDGTFEFLISATPPPKDLKINWLELRGPPKGPTNALLIVRQTFIDRTKEVAADMSLKRVSGEHIPSPLTAARVEDALQTSALFVCGASMMFSRWSYGFQKHANTLPLFDQETSNRAGGDPQIRYYHSYWMLKDDECLVIRAKPPPCEHWNFQLNNHWMESLDYRYFQVHVNKGSAKYDQDGNVLVIVAHQDPEQSCSEEMLKIIRPYYWIDTNNHRQGQMLWRWVKAKVPENELPHPQCEVRKFGVF